MGLFCIAVACDLKEDTPQNVLDILIHMVGMERREFDVLPVHVFFKYDDWETLISDVRLRWFPGEGGAALRRVSRYNRSETQGGGPVYFHSFSFRCEEKDDGITWFFEFLDWLAPYSQTQGFVGYWQDEDDQHPNLLYFQEGKFGVFEINGPPQIVEFGTV